MRLAEHCGKCLNRNLTKVWVIQPIYQLENKIHVTIYQVSFILKKVLLDENARKTYVKENVLYFKIDK